MPDQDTEDGLKCGLGKLLISRIFMEMFLLQQLDTILQKTTTMLRYKLTKLMAR
jgi:hypothetical protein